MSLVQAGEVKLHYQKIGEGQPNVIFLHGLVMDNLSSWYFTLANSVAQVATSIVYDLRGHGYSERPKSGYRIGNHLIDLKNLITELNLKPPIILIGNSFGGLLAINFAKFYPNLAQGLILVDAQMNDSVWREDMVRSLSLKGDERNQVIVENFKNWMGRNSQRKTNRLVKTAETLVYQTSLVDDLQVSEEIFDDDLKNIHCPMLALYGGKSKILEQGRRIKWNVPNCQLKVFEGCTHSILWERTEGVRKTTLDWIQTLQKVLEN